MRNLVVACGLLAGALVVLAQAPSTRVSAQEKTAPPKPAPKVEAPKPSTVQVPAKKIESAKAEKIRQLMELTGTKNLGEDMMKAGMDQFRASVTESQPNNPRATQFVDAFVAGFQKHFDVSSLNDKVVPIYDKYLSDEDVKGLLEYYRSPLGQRMMKVLPEVARESQALGFTLGQKAAQDTFEELKRISRNSFPNRRTRQAPTKIADRASRKNRSNEPED